MGKDKSQKSNHGTTGSVLSVLTTAEERAALADVENSKPVFLIEEKKPEIKYDEQDQLDYLNNIFAGIHVKAEILKDCLVITPHMQGITIIGKPTEQMQDAFSEKVAFEIANLDVSQTMTSSDKELEITYNKETTANILKSVQMKIDNPIQESGIDSDNKESAPFKVEPRNNI